MAEKHQHPHAHTQIAVIVAGFHAEVADLLLSSTVDTLQQEGMQEDNILIVNVAGALELSVVAQKIAANRNRYGRVQPAFRAVAIIALGAVIRGETAHFDYVCRECSRGLQRVSVKHEIPVIFGVLTTDNLEQAMVRAGTGAGCKNKGKAFAATALSMVETMRFVDFKTRESWRPPERPFRASVRNRRDRSESP